MRVALDKCEICVVEAILKDQPDYIMEQWGKMSIYAEYEKKVPEAWCIVSGDNMETVCLKHLGVCLIV